MDSESDVPPFMEWEAEGYSVDTPSVAAEEENASPRSEALGLHREEWVKKEVILLGDSNEEVAVAIVQFVGAFSHPDGGEALGDDNVGVVICEILNGESSIIPHTIRRWSTSKTLYEGVPLAELEQIAKAKVEAGVRSYGNRKGVRQYRSTRTRKERGLNPKKQKVLLPASILQSLRRDCCHRACMRQFTTRELATLREELYYANPKARNAMKLGVHRGFHCCSDTGQKLTVVEGKVVCLKAWRYVFDISAENFSRFKKLVGAGARAQNHGNAGKQRQSAPMVQALATMKTLLDARAESMPHRTHTTPEGEKVVQKILPSGTKWKNLLTEVNHVQEQCGVKQISQSSCSKIRRRHFSEFQVKRRGDAFARCGKCDKILKLRNQHPPGSKAHDHFQTVYERHIRESEACRAAYYASRAISCHRPLQVLCIMHDKMDHSKTALPCMARRTKALEGLAKLPVSVAGILAHGHGDKKFAHFTVDLYPSDSNQTIGSIAKLLRDLEAPPKTSNPTSLFEYCGRTELYGALLEGAQQCSGSLLQKECTHGEFQPLPPILHVQMDNCWKDNKSRFVLCFWSLLVARGVFEEIHVSFMLVGHTHDDIDASFGRWSMKLHENDHPTLPELMQSYMTLDKDPVIPSLIEEVPDFKAFIEDFTTDDDLEGHSHGRQFLFYRGANGSPLMQYKLHCTDRIWLPAEGIQLWKELPNGKAHLPEGVPNAVKPKSLKAHDDVVKGITGYISHWESLIRNDPSGPSSSKYTQYIEYWSAVVEALGEKEMESTWKLLFGFWPCTRQTTNILTMHDVYGNLREEFDEDDHYIGPRSLRPPPSLRLSRDCFAGYFMLVRPAEDSDAPIWLGEAKSDPILQFGSENYKKIRVRWYIPCKRRGYDDNAYDGWDTTDHFKWELDSNYEEQWLETDSILTSWKSRRRSPTSKVTVPKNQVIFALDNLARSFLEPN